jgi:hypothetical protein
MSVMSEPPRWTVVVLRAWIDAGRLRVRLLRTGSAGESDRAVASTATQATRVVEGWLDELLAAHDAPQTRDRRRRRRWLPRFGR